MCKSIVVHVSGEEPNRLTVHVHSSHAPPGLRDRMPPTLHITPVPSPKYIYIYVCISANVGTSGGYQVYDDRDTFYAALVNFTEDEANVRFASNIVYNDDGEIEASSCSRISCRVVGTRETNAFRADPKWSSFGIVASIGVKDANHRFTYVNHRFIFHGR